MFEKNSPSFRQRNSVFRAIKKRHSEILFQRLDLKCDRRLCEIESFGSLSEIQIIGNCAEDLQSEIFHFGSSCKPLTLSARCRGTYIKSDELARPKELSAYKEKQALRHGTACFGTTSVR